MSEKQLVPQQEFLEVVQRIKTTQQKAFIQANILLIELYWDIGKLISEKVASQSWGKSVVSQLAQYIEKTDPEIKGFSDKNLWRMKQFYETYRDNGKLTPLVRDLPWTHNTIIFSRCKTEEEREYYLTLCRKEKYSSRELERQIDSCQFERVVLSDQKLSAVLREIHPSINNNFKDNYVLEFLGLPQEHSERNLQTALVAQYTLQLPDKKLIQAKLHNLLEDAGV
ncbi:MAG: DUF1016 domain-containing protein [Spirochaetales bacterium]|nr:DUF1016 domain-containing protein [Spirochaetales bacterium]